MLEDVTRLGEAAGIEAAARELRAELEARLAAVRAAVDGAPRPRVIALEWLEPPYVGGHWVPEMVAIAGGEDVAGPPGLKSPEVEWETLSALGPDVVVSMPCGWHAERARAETLEHWDRVAALGAGRVFAVDAAATFSRPGPRLVDGVELLGHLFHPDRVEAPGSIGFAELRAPERRRGTPNRSGDDDRGGEADHGEGGHRGDLDRPSGAAQHPPVPGDDHEARRAGPRRARRGGPRC